MLNTTWQAAAPQVRNLKGLLVHDAYHMQGREKDVAIFSTVRGGKKHAGIGFVADERRVNVGLTRARSSLIVIGNAKALKSDEVWGNLVKQATVGGSVLHFPLACCGLACSHTTCAFITIGVQMLLGSSVIAVSPVLRT